MTGGDAIALLEYVISQTVVTLPFACDAPLVQMGTFTYEMSRYYTARIVLALDHLHSQVRLRRSLYGN
jgi:hypothetical protein